MKEEEEGEEGEEGERIGGEGRGGGEGWMSGLGKERDLKGQ